MLNWFNKKLNTTEYLELKKDLESLRIKFEGLQLEFDLIVKKLKVKYKINRKEEEEEEESKSINNPVLLPVK